MIFHGVVEGGKVRWNDPAGVSRHVAKFEGQQVSIEIDKRRYKRSDRANRFFHGPVLDAMVDATGYDKDQCKAILKAMFLMAERDGRAYVRETSSLNSKEFAEFVDNCIRWLAVEFGCVFGDWRQWNEAA